jgi:hypothetical protein
MTGIGVFMPMAIPAQSAMLDAVNISHWSYPRRPTQGREMAMDPALDSIL